MEERRTRILLAAATAASASLLAVSVALAKGNFLKTLVISQDTGELRVVNDPDLGGFFSLSDFADGTSDPVVPGSTYMESYELTRLAVGQNGGLIAIDRLRYVPPGSKEHGYIFYEGLINGSSEYDGQWFSATVDGDAIMKRVLDSPMTASSSLPQSTVALVSYVAFVAGLSIGALIQRRRTALGPNTPKVPMIPAA